MTFVRITRNGNPQFLAKIFSGLPQDYLEHRPIDRIVRAV